MYYFVSAANVDYDTYFYYVLYGLLMNSKLFTKIFTIICWMKLVLRTEKLRCTIIEIGHYRKQADFKDKFIKWEIINELNDKQEMKQTTINHWNKRQTINELNDNQSMN